jgi:serine/threonine protein kinase
MTGGALSEALVAETFTTFQKVECCLQIAQALEFIHKENIIHRDLSARNCLVPSLCLICI